MRRSLCVFPALNLNFDSPALLVQLAASAQSTFLSIISYEIYTCQRTKVHFSIDQIVVTLGGWVKADDLNKIFHDSLVAAVVVVALM